MHQPGNQRPDKGGKIGGWEAGKLGGWEARRLGGWEVIKLKAECNWGSKQLGAESSKVKAERKKFTAEIAENAEGIELKNKKIVILP